VSRLVFKRELQLGAVGDRPAFLQVNVLLNDLSHPKIANRPTSRRDRPRDHPGYHLHKRHWNTVALDGSVPDEEVLELVDHSYDLMVARLTKAQRGQLAT
jgi:predicted DNA-binding protein (MmcQ/YjbR family)